MCVEECASASVCVSEWVTSKKKSEQFVLRPTETIVLHLCKFLAVVGFIFFPLPSLLSCRRSIAVQEDKQEQSQPAQTESKDREKKVEGGGWRSWRLQKKERRADEESRLTET